MHSWHFPRVLSFKKNTGQIDHYLFSLLKHPEEGGHGTNVKGVRSDGHDVVQDASQLSVQNCKHNTEHNKPFKVDESIDQKE